MTVEQMRVVEKYLAEFEAMKGNGDQEAVHGMADDLLLAALHELGFGVLSDAWEKASVECGGFWYA